MEKVTLEQRPNASEGVTQEGLCGKEEHVQAGATACAKALRSWRSSLDAVTGVEGRGSVQSSKVRPGQQDLLDQEKDFSN